MADKLLARYSALLSGSELLLGSVIHGIKIPFGGHFLSLIQLGLMSDLEQKTRAFPDTFFFPWLSSNIAASLKTLSPAGKRLTPMFAISMQGFLFNTGQFFLGRNVAGALVGGVALVLWAFVQPLFFAWIYFGEAFTKGLKKVISEIEGFVPGVGGWLLYAVLGFIFLKTLLGIFVVLWVNVSKSESKARIIESFEKKLRMSNAEPIQNSPELNESAQEKPFRRVFSFAGMKAGKGFFRKVYVLYALAFFLSLVSIVFVQSPLATKIWWALRPLGAYFLIWLFLRFVPVTEWPRHAERFFPSFSKGLHATLNEFSKADTPSDKRR